MSDAAPLPADASVADRLYEAFLGALDLFAVHLGDRLGYYSALVDGPLTADELAGRCGSHPRYAREWLEQQAVSGLLSVESDDAAGVDDDASDRRRYRLPDATARALVDTRGTEYSAPLARFTAAVGSRIDALTTAHRTGGGVSWREFGEHARQAQADMNRPWFESELAPAFAGVPELAAILGRPGANVVDIGCGAGWSTIAVGRAWPQARVVGVDIDSPSIELARENARLAGTANVEFIAGDAQLLSTGGFDLALAFECIHDMPRPVEVLASVRAVLAEGAPLVVMDEAVGPAFSTDGDGDHAFDRVMYGFSVLLCLPDSMSHPDSVATGTVMRPSTLGRYAREAGFATVDVLPIEDFGFWRFYRLG
ncbi:class I SAM-dependent methyltransferase [Intrasporangium flavum]|uniref:class I SAM-dependent methyltransferase n=1 Tax=Intrasporangium flavum TaxID=1428657 RepID=UPI00096D9C2C|nr:class I SAM-dependent methyltransferase [Intrasporangium flavum]